MTPREFAVGSTGASLAGIAANHLLTDRTKHEKKNVDKQLAASAIGANAAHLLINKMATLQETLNREKAAQFAFVKSFTKTASLSAIKAGKSTEEARAVARAYLEKSASYKARKSLIENLEKIAFESDPKEVQKHEKLASLGFQEADVKALKQTNPALIEKLASATEQPWAFGEPSGHMTKAAMDPLLAFCLGS